MFIPVNKELVINGEFNGNSVTDIYGYDCTNTNDDTKSILSIVNKGGIVYITHFNFKEAVAAAVALNNLIHVVKLAQKNPIQARNLKVISDVNGYEHKRVNILSVRLKPLVKKNTKFSVNGNNYIVSAITPILVNENLTLPFYEVCNIDDGVIMENVTQDYLLKFTGIQFDGESRNVAVVMVGNSEFQARYNVSLNDKMNYMYCASPSTKTDDGMFKFMKHIDEFGVNCLEYVESAIVRLVLGLMGSKTGNYMKDMFLSKKTKPSCNNSCHNCKGCRRLTLSDTHVGDSNGTILGSRPTGDLTKTGQYEKTLICAFDMKVIGEESINEFNKESIHGDNRSGHKAGVSELYRDIALNCPRFQDKDNKFISNDVHTCLVNKDTVIIETVGIQLHFYKGKVTTNKTEVKVDNRTKVK